jgi:hypothetical protein
MEGFDDKHGELWRTALLPVKPWTRKVVQRSDLFRDHGAYRYHSGPGVVLNGGRAAERPGLLGASAPPELQDGR